MASKELIAELQALRELRFGGKIAILRKARKRFTCKDCGLPIEPGTEYCHVELCGSGLGSIKFPDRFHIECLEKQLD